MEKKPSAEKAVREIRRKSPANINGSCAW